MVPDRPPLAFIGAELAIEPAGGLTAPVDLEIGPDSLVLIDLASPQRATLFADAAMGLVAPARGRVMFQGRDWAEATPDQARALRGRIGRFLLEPGWIPHLTLADNVLLRPAYHTRIGGDALLAEAVSLCRTLGMPGLPAGFPADVPEGDLACAALARAFLGGPRLVILEHPTAALGMALLGPLLRLIRDVRDEGGAALWLVHGDVRDLRAAVPATRQYRLAADRLVRLGGASA